MAESVLPSGWQERTDADREITRYNPQPISRFEHTESGVGVRLTPSDPGTETGSDGEGEYRVGASTEGVSAPSAMVEVASAADHAEAFGVAREFMEAYNERCIDGDVSADAVIADRCE